MFKSIIFVSIIVLIIDSGINCYKKPHSLNQRKHGISKNHKALAKDSSDMNSNETTGSAVNQRAAQLARYIVHNSNWASMATNSLQSNWKGHPYVNIKSMSDGTASNSSGIPYFYMTPRDTTVKDLEKDNSASIMMSMEQDLYCTKHDMDPEYPKCGHVVILGQVDKLESGTVEYEFAKSAMFERHPSMETWPENHNFFLAKMTISEVQVVDGIGGPKIIPLEEYYHTDPVGPEN